MNAFTLFLTLAVSTGVVLFLLKLQRTKQLAYIDDYKFHRSLRDKLAAKHPTLNDEQVDLVLQALKDYFWMCNKGKRKMVAMPSQVVDDAWHEFILFTRSYKQFCDKALGRFLHHTPTEAMSSPTVAQEGIRRAWRLACAKAEINPRTPDRLPLIFGIDALLNIPNGFTYVLDCQDRNSPAYGSGYCAGHIACTGGCTGGCAGDSGGSSCGSDGGSSCGGGCGGGD